MTDTAKKSPTIESLYCGPMDRQEIVSSLEQLLELARDGEIEGMCVVALSPRRLTSTVCANSGAHSLEMIGELRLMCHRVERLTLIQRVERLTLIQRVELDDHAIYD